MDYFFISVLGFVFGVLIRSLLTFGWPVLVFALLLSALCVGAWIREKTFWYGAASIFMLAAVLGIGRTMFAPQSLPVVFATLLDTKISLTGTVVADPDTRDTNQHVTIEIEKDRVKTKILAFAPPYPTFSYGEKVSVSGKLEAPEPFDTDGGRTFRYDRYLAKDGIFAILPQGYIKSEEPPSGVFVSFMDFLYGIKHTFVHGLENALPEPHAALAEGLLAGGKQGLGKNLLDAFTTSGLLQIVVLSGYNVMIVAEAISRAFSFLPKRFALGAAGIGIIGFIVAAGSGSSAVRAGFMACLALYAQGSNRSYNALRALFATLLLMLLWNPFYLAYDPGFELSFAATLGLILGTPVVEQRLLWVRNAFMREIWATTIAAQVAVLPLLLWQTGNLSFVSFAANVLVMPAVPAAMAASFGAGLMGVVFPVISTVFGIPAYILLAYIIAVGKYSAALPFAHVMLPAFPFSLVVLMYAALVWWYMRMIRRAAPLAQPASFKKS